MLTNINFGGIHNMNKELSTLKAISAIFIGIFVLAISQIISSTFYLLPLPETITSILFGTVYVLLTYLLLSLLCKRLTSKSLAQFGISKPRIHIIWLAIGIILPVMVSNILLLTPGTYINNGKSSNEIISTIIIAIFTVGFGAGFAEELIFRGFIMNALKLRWGKLVSILIPSMIFGLIHATGGMNLWDISMLFIAGTSVGIMFSLIAYEYSVWSSAIVHALWNVVMIGKILDIGVNHRTDAVYSYILTSKSTLLTGGSFGVEASIISIVGYIMVICFVLYRSNKKKIIA
jgi:hypothetical protein